MIRDTFKSDGVLGFYNGFVATVAREMPGYFFFFGGYEASKYVLATTDDMKTEPYGKLAYLILDLHLLLCIFVSFWPLVHNKFNF